MPDILTIWTIYRDPLDYPGQYVTRACTIGPNGRIANADVPIYAGPSLEAAREVVPTQCTRIDRHPHDGQQILEVWL